MKRKKGDGRGRLGGREKGTPNKKTEALIAICEKHGVEPFEGMVLMAKTCSDFDLKFQILREICHYIHPKRKAIELSTGSSGEEVKPLVIEFVRPK